MKRITEIRIPKGENCGECKFSDWKRGYDFCGLFDEKLGLRGSFRCFGCLKMFPDGAVFELKEKK